MMYKCCLDCGYDEDDIESKCPRCGSKDIIAVDVDSKLILTSAMCY